MSKEEIEKKRNDEAIERGIKNERARQIKAVEGAIKQLVKEQLKVTAAAAQISNLDANNVHARRELGLLRDQLNTQTAILAQSQQEALRMLDDERMYPDLVDKVKGIIARQNECNRQLSYLADRHEALVAQAEECSREIAELRRTVTDLQQRISQELNSARRKRDNSRFDDPDAQPEKEHQDQAELFRREIEQAESRIRQLHKQQRANGRENNKAWSSANKVASEIFELDAQLDKARWLMDTKDSREAWNKAFQFFVKAGIVGLVGGRIVYQIPGGDVFLEGLKRLVPETINHISLQAYRNAQLSTVAQTIPGGQTALNTLNGENLKQATLANVNLTKIQESITALNTISQNNFYKLLNAMMASGGAGVAGGAIAGLIGLFSIKRSGQREFDDDYIGRILKGVQSITDIYLDKETGKITDKNAFARSAFELLGDNLNPEQREYLNQNSGQALEYLRQLARDDLDQSQISQALSDFANSLERICQGMNPGSVSTSRTLALGVIGAIGITGGLSGYTGYMASQVVINQSRATVAQTYNSLRNQGVLSNQVAIEKQMDKLADALATKLQISKEEALTKVKDFIAAESPGSLSFANSIKKFGQLVNLSKNPDLLELVASLALMLASAYSGVKATQSIQSIEVGQKTPRFPVYGKNIRRKKPEKPEIDKDGNTIDTTSAIARRKIGLVRKLANGLIDRNLGDVVSGLRNSLDAILNVAMGESGSENQELAQPTQGLGMLDDSGSGDGNGNNGNGKGRSNPNRPEEPEPESEKPQYPTPQWTGGEGSYGSFIKSLAQSVKDFSKHTGQLVSQEYQCRLGRGKISITMLDKPRSESDAKRFELVYTFTGQDRRITSDTITLYEFDDTLQIKFFLAKVDEMNAQGSFENSGLGGIALKFVTDLGRSMSKKQIVIEDPDIDARLFYNKRGFENISNGNLVLNIDQNLPQTPQTPTPGISALKSKEVSNNKKPQYPRPQWTGGEGAYNYFIESLAQSVKDFSKHTGQLVSQEYQCRLGKGKLEIEPINFRNISGGKSLTIKYTFIDNNGKITEDFVLIDIKIDSGYIDIKSFLQSGKFRGNGIGSIADIIVKNIAQQLKINRIRIPESTDTGINFWTKMGYRSNGGKNLIYDQNSLQTPQTPTPGIGALKSKEDSNNKKPQYPKPQWTGGEDAYNYFIESLAQSIKNDVKNISQLVSQEYECKLGKGKISIEMRNPPRPEDNGKHFNIKYTFTDQNGIITSDTINIGETNDILEIRNFLIKDNCFDGSGLGMYALDFVVQLAKSMGKKQVLIKNPNKSAVAFYKKNGFEEISNGDLILNIDQNSPQGPDGITPQDPNAKSGLSNTGDTPNNGSGNGNNGKPPTPPTGTGGETGDEGEDSDDLIFNEQKYQEYLATLINDGESLRGDELWVHINQMRADIATYEKEFTDLKKKVYKATVLKKDSNGDEIPHTSDDLLKIESATKELNNHIHNQFGQIVARIDAITHLATKYGIVAGGKQLYYTHSALTGGLDSLVRLANITTTHSKSKQYIDLMPQGNHSHLRKIIAHTVNKICFFVGGSPTLATLRQGDETSGMSYVGNGFIHQPPQIFFDTWNIGKLRMGIGFDDNISRNAIKALSDQLEILPTVISNKKRDVLFNVSNSTVITNVTYVGIDTSNTSTETTHYKLNITTRDFDSGDIPAFSNGAIYSGGQGHNVEQSHQIIVDSAGNLVDSISKQIPDPFDKMPKKLRDALEANGFLPDKNMINVYGFPPDGPSERALKRYFQNLRDYGYVVPFIANPYLQTNLDQRRFFVPDAYITAPNGNSLIVDFCGTAHKNIEGKIETTVNKIYIIPKMQKALKKKGFDLADYYCAHDDLYEGDNLEQTEAIDTYRDNIGKILIDILSDGIKTVLERDFEIIKIQGSTKDFYRHKTNGIMYFKGLRSFFINLNYLLAMYPRMGKVYTEIKKKHDAILPQNLPF